MITHCAPKGKGKPRGGKRIVKTSREIAELFFGKPMYGREKQALRTQEQRDREDGSGGKADEKGEREEEEKEAPGDKRKVRVPAMKRVHDVLIAQWNMGKRQRALEGMMAWMEERGIDVMCLQEAQNIKTRRTWIESKGYNLYWHEKVAILTRIETTERRKVTPVWRHGEKNMMAMTLAMGTDTLQIINAYIEGADGNRTETATTQRTQDHMELLARAQEGDERTHTVMVMDANETVEPRGRCQVHVAGGPMRVVYPNEGIVRTPELSAMACHTTTMVDAHRETHPDLYGGQGADPQATYTHQMTSREGMISKARIDYSWLSRGIKHRLESCEIVNEGWEWSGGGEERQGSMHSVIVTKLKWHNAWLCSSQEAAKTYDLKGSELPLKLNTSRLNAETRRQMAEHVQEALEAIEKRICEIAEGRGDPMDRAQRLVDVLENAAIKAGNRHLGRRRAHTYDGEAAIEREDNRWKDMVQAAREAVASEDKGMDERVNMRRHADWLGVKYGIETPTTLGGWDVWLMEEERHETEFRKRRTNIHTTDWWATRNRKAFYKLVMKDFESTRISSLMTTTGRIVTDPVSIEGELLSFIHALGDCDEHIQSDDEQEGEAREKGWKRRKELGDDILLAPPKLREVRRALSDLGNVSASGRLAPAVLKAITLTRIRTKEVYTGAQVKARRNERERGMPGRMSGSHLGMRATMMLETNQGGMNARPAVQSASCET